ncbi:MAG: hypothetical protein RLY31_2160 [Bacteroidota bacterium]
MKDFSLSMLLAFGLANLSAQPTLTSAYFPALGDTLRTATDIAPEGIVITPAGGPYDWDYSNLSISFQQEVVFRPAAEGNAADQFPNADLFTGNGNGGETYYNQTATAFQVLGFNGPDPTGVGIPTLVKFTNPIPERHAPLSFPSTFNSASALVLPFSTDNLPSEILDSLGVPFLPDSIRIRVTTNRSDFVDAYGTMTIPGGSYPVLREKRTELLETRLDVLVPFLGWQDVTDLIPAGGGPFAGLGKDTTVTYHFFAADVKEAVAVVSTDADGLTPVQVAFKDNGVSTATTGIPTSDATVRFKPNPVSDIATLSWEGPAADGGLLQVFDAHGRTALLLPVPAGSPASVDIDLSNLLPGTYFYRLTRRNQPLPATTGTFVKVSR